MVGAAGGKMDNYIFIFNDLTVVPYYFIVYQTESWRFVGSYV